MDMQHKSVVICGLWHQSQVRSTSKCSPFCQETSHASRVVFIVHPLFDSFHWASLWGFPRGSDVQPKKLLDNFACQASIEDQLKVEDLRIQATEYEDILNII